MRGGILASDGLPRNNMKKIITTVIISLFTSLIGYIIGQFQGRSDASVESFKVYNVWLISYYGFPENRKIELPDFLKARYYYFANRVPVGVLGEPYDFGDVNFVGPAIGKDLTSPQHEYQLFKDKKVTFKKPFETSSSETNK